jgi:hypothetical protein
MTSRMRDIRGELELVDAARAAFAADSFNLARDVARRVFASGRRHDDAAAIALRTIATMRSTLSRYSRRARIAWGLMLALSLFVCAPSEAQSPSPTGLPSPLPAPSSAMPSPVPSSLPPAWMSFERAWTGISGYTATVTVFERRGDEVQHVAFDYTFDKPSSATVHVIKGPNAGVTLVWNGGSTVIAHRGSGLVALFKKTMSLHDPLITTIRGSSIDQLSFAAILTHAQDTAGPVTQSIGPVINGTPTTAVTLIPASSATDASLTREVVDISLSTSLPVRVLGYSETTLVRQIDFTNVRVKLGR